MEKLISMTEKVLELQTQLKRCIEQSMPFTDLQSLKQSIQDKIFKHANFLSQKLELSMFVPCELVDGVWIVLECPHNYGLLHNYPTGHKLMDENFKEALQYQEAKDRVLFEGFKYEKTNWDLADLIHLVKRKNMEFVKNDNFCILDIDEFTNKTIEFLDKQNLILTEIAQKQLS